jgi:uroporphyrinogen-III synthase
MPAPNHQILATKKLSELCKQKLLDAEFCIDEIEFIKIKLLRFQKENIRENIILTSKNAFKSLLQQIPIERLRRSSFFVVGNQTGQALLSLGLNVTELKPYGEHLAEAIIKHHFTKSFTYFSGNLRRDLLPKMLVENGISLEEEMAYQTDLNPQKIDRKYDGILFFSPSGVSSFLTSNTLGGEMCFCIGKTTAIALEGKTPNILVAKTPNMESLTDLCIQYYSTPLS